LALRQLGEHLDLDGYQPRRCWTCALLTTACPECDTSLTEMTSEHHAHHRTVGPWVAIGCELYVTPALRAAVLPPAR
jgi:hypothetical protein